MMTSCISEELPSPSAVFLLIVAAAASRAVVAVALLAGGLDDEPETLHFLIVHLLDSRLSVIVVLKLLNG